MVSLLVGGVAGWWVVGSVNELVGCWFHWFMDFLVGGWLGECWVGELVSFCIHWLIG